MMPPPKNGYGYSNQESPSAKICSGVNASPFGSALDVTDLAALFDRGRRAPRLFMMAIVALYSRIRLATSSRLSLLSFLRSAPTEAGDAGGAALLRIARAASFGCLAKARALASSSVTGPVAAIVLVRALARVFLTVLRFARAAIGSPSLTNVGDARSPSPSGYGMISMRSASRL